MKTTDRYKCDTCGYTYSEMQHQHEMSQLFGSVQEKPLPKPDLEIEPLQVEPKVEERLETGFHHALGECPDCGGEHWLNVALAPITELPPVEKKAEGEVEETQPVDSASADVVPPSPEHSTEPIVDSYNPVELAKKITPK